MAIDNFKNLVRTAPHLAAAALFVTTGLLVAPTAAEAATGSACGGTIVVFGSQLCSDGASAGPNSTTQFTYFFGGASSGTTDAFIPLLDANAIVSGSFEIGGVSATPDLITGASVAADWDLTAGEETTLGGKSESAFDDPAALIEISLAADVRTNVTFDSADPEVSGPILVDNNLADPPLPGTPAPEPGTLALFGSALAGFGFFRRRRNRT